jgi:polyhydroxybutyrate depolymerase
MLDWRTCVSSRALAWISAASLLLGGLLLPACARPALSQSAPAEATTAVGPGPDTGSITVGGLIRTYRLHLPTGYTEGQPTPVVLAFHGSGGTGKAMAELTGLDATADDNGFMVIYPDGVGRHWNIGATGVDDVAFVAALLDQVATEYTLDRGHIYATGMSNGGFFAIYLGCTPSSGLAAIAPVAASMTDGLVQYCTNGPKIAVHMILGTTDPIVPWNGSEPHLGPWTQKLLSAPATREFWAEHDGVADQPSVDEWLPDTDPDDGTRIHRVGFGNNQVVLDEVVNGGHTWPGGLQYLPKWIVGRTSRHFNASDVIWSFFADEPQRQE